MFPITNILDATNESNFMSQTLGCVNGVGATTNAVTEAMSAYGNSELFVGAT